MGVTQITGPKITIKKFVDPGVTDGASVLDAGTINVSVIEAPAGSDLLIIADAGVRINTLNGAPVLWNGVPFITQSAINDIVDQVNELNEKVITLGQDVETLNGQVSSLTVTVTALAVKINGIQQGEILSWSDINPDPIVVADLVSPIPAERQGNIISFKDSSNTYIGVLRYNIINNTPEVYFHAGATGAEAEDSYIQLVDYNNIWTRSQSYNRTDVDNLLAGINANIATLQEDFERLSNELNPANVIRVNNQDPTADHQTLGSALGVATFGDTIEVAPGTYNEGTININDLSNILIIAEGNINQTRVQIIGDWTISGTSTRLALKGLQITGSITKTENNTENTIYIDDCTISNGITIPSGYVQMNNVYINNGVSFVIQGFVYMRDCAGESNCNVVMTSYPGSTAANKTLVMVNCELFHIVHQAGSLVMQGSNSITKQSYTYALESTATVSNGALFIFGTVSVTGTNLDPISVTGDCPKRVNQMYCDWGNSTVNWTNRFTDDGLSPLCLSPSMFADGKVVSMSQDTTTGIWTPKITGEDQSTSTNFVFATDLNAIIQFNNAVISDRSWAIRVNSLYSVAAGNSYLNALYNSNGNLSDYYQISATLGFNVVTTTHANFTCTDITYNGAGTNTVGGIALVGDNSNMDADIIVEYIDPSTPLYCRHIKLDGTVRTYQITKGTMNGIIDARYCWAEVSGGRPEATEWPEFTALEFTGTDTLTANEALYGWVTVWYTLEPVMARYSMIETGGEYSKQYTEKISYAEQEMQSIEKEIKSKKTRNK